MALSVGELIAYLRLESAQFDTGIAAARAELSSASVSAQRFGASVSQSEAALSGAGRQANVASSGTAKFRAAQLSALAATERYNALLNDESASLGRLATAEASVIRANERLKTSSPAAAIMTTNREIASSPGLLSRTSSGLVQATKSMVGLGVAFGAFEAVKHITQASNEFQRAMIQVQTNADVTHSEVVKASAALLAMAGPVAAAPEKLAIAFYHAKSVGLDYAHAIDTTRIAAEGARVGNADLEETMNALTATVASGIPGVSNMSQAMGTLIAIVGSGDMKLADLNAALGSGILTVVKGYGLSLIDVGAALATFGDNNIRGAEAATMLRMAVQAMAVPAKAGAKELRTLGLTASTLRKDMQTGGLDKAVLDLRNHLNAAGIKANEVGGVLTEVFGKRAGPGVAVLVGQVDRLQSKFRILRDSGATFADKWKATTETASFALASLGHSLEAAGIQADSKFGPAIASIARLLVGALKVGLEIAKGALAPFVDAWHTLSPVLSAVGSALGEVAHFLSPIAPILGGVAAAAGTAWLAFKGYTIARAAVFAVLDAVAILQGKAAASLSAFRVYGQGVNATLAGNATESQLTSQIMQAEMLQVGAAAQAEAAEVDRAKAREAAAYADVVAASRASTDAQVASAEEVSAAAQAQAAASTRAAAQTAAAADAAAVDIVASGETASIGWAAMLGPLALVAVGIAALIPLFGHSTSASKEATDAAKAYADAIKADPSRGTLISTIVDQLKKNGVAAELAKVNAQLKGSAITGQQFVTAIELGGKPLEDLRAKLQGVVKAGTTFQAVVGGRGGGGLVAHLTPAAQAAAAALKHLNDEYSGLSKATKQDLIDTKTFAGAASSIDKVASSTQVASDTAKQYAEMVGIQVDKNGVAAVSADVLTAAVAGVSHAYNTATVAGSDFLAALSTFSKSTGTAADRAALIGATLKAANGDALGFAGSMATLAQAERQLVTDLRSAQPVQDAVTKATAGMADGAAKTAVAAHAADRAMKGYIGTIVNLRTGTINYSAQGAGPLITDLQSIQTAAMSAASATYQHEIATKGATAAADDAYNVYANQTRGSLINQAGQLHLTAGQATKLADAYFGMPDDVKTRIEQEGANPILDVLNQLGTQLAYLTGHPWNPKVGLSDVASERTDAIQHKLEALDGRTFTAIVDVVLAISQGSASAAGHVGQSRGGGPNAAGSGPGGVRDGWFTVGEQGGNPNSWELGHKSGSRVDIFSNARSRAMTGMSRVPGFAGGSGFHLGGVGYPDQSSYQSALNSLVHAAAAMLAAANNTHASAQDIHSAAADLVGAAHTQKLSAQLQQTLAMQGGRVSALASQRDRVSAMLGSGPTAPTAYDRLGAAQGAYAQEQSSVTGAFGFDVTTAGQNSWGVSTAGGILAAIQKTAANARTFSTVVKKLAKDGLARGLVMQLAAAGPQALSAAQALAAATPAQLAEINADYRDLNATAIGTGTSIADDYFKSGVDAASAIVRGLQSQGTLLNNAIRALSAQMVSELEAGLGIKQSPGARPPAGNVTVHVHGVNDPNANAIAMARQLAMRAA